MSPINANSPPPKNVIIITFFGPAAAPFHLPSPLH